MACLARSCGMLARFTEIALQGLSGGKTGATATLGSCCLRSVGCLPFVCERFELLTGDHRALCQVHQHPCKVLRHLRRHGHASEEGCCRKRAVQNLRLYDAAGSSTGVAMAAKTVHPCTVMS
eukprot:6479095-Amphidinium_carterae.3